MAEGKAKVGLSTEQWIKMWDEGFQHNIDYDDDHHHGDEHHGHHGHDHHHGHEHHEHDHHHGDGDDEFYDCHGSGKVDLYLQKHILRLTKGKPSITILVSLCGDSPDLAWLSEQGHNVVGIEVSEKAVKQLFENNRNGAIPYSVSTEGEFKIYSATDGKNLKVYVGDFFAATPSSVGTFDAIWDCHGIISIPTDQHAQFAEKLCQLLKPDGAILFSTVYYDSNDLKTGPAPCAFGVDETKKIFPKDFDVELLDCPKMRPQNFNLPWMKNPIIFVSKK